MLDRGFSKRRQMPAVPAADEYVGLSVGIERAGRKVEDAGWWVTLERVERDREILAELTARCRGKQQRSQSGALKGDPVHGGPACQISR